MAFIGKSAVVFGGSGGIGVEMCKNLLNNGLSRLAVLDVNELSSDVHGELSRCNAAADIISKKCDITNTKLMEDVIYNQLLPKMEYIDVLVNSAGSVDERDPGRLISINLTGVINSSLLALKLMSKGNPGGKGGIVVNVSSIAGLEPTPFMSVYSASKFGVTGFTRGMADNLVYNQTGVKFLTICPGATDTTLISKFFAGEDLLFPWMSATVLEVKKQYPPQSPSVVGECLVEAILDAENGAIWISMNGLNFKMEKKENQFLKSTNN